MVALVRAGLMGVLFQVSGLLKREDISKIGRSECAKNNIPPNQMNIHGGFYERIRRNMHVIISMNPIGSMFRNRLRML